MHGLGYDSMWDADWCVKSGGVPDSPGTVHAIGYWFSIALTPVGAATCTGAAERDVLSTAPARFGGHEHSGWRQCVVMLENPVDIAYVGNP